MIAALMALALAATLSPPVAVADEGVAPGRGRRCTPHAEVCYRGIIHTCTAAGRWVRGIDCRAADRQRAQHERREDHRRVTVCAVEEGVAACVESGGLRRWRRRGGAR